MERLNNNKTLKEHSYFGEFLFNSTLKNPDKVALADQKRSLTYIQFINEIFQAREQIISLGVSKGDRVIVSLGNTVDHMVYHYAIMLSGAVSVPLASEVFGDKLHPYIQDTECSLVIIPSGVMSGNLEKKADIGFSEKKSLTLDDIKKVQSEVDIEKCSDIATIMYTTGTTGKPKGVILNHVTLLESLYKITDYVPYFEDSKELVVLPISHSFGLGHVYSSHINGVSVYVLNGLTKIKKVFNTMKDENITHFPATPAIVDLFLGRYVEKFKEASKELGVMVVNSAPLHPDKSKELLGVKPGLSLIIYYGLTEASRSTLITLSDLEFSDYHKVGKPNTGIEIKLINEEVCIKGTHLFAGYWRNEAETKKVVRDGWFHTGDLGAFDSEGRLAITGRLKNQINVAGLKVSSTMVENAIKSVSTVLDTAVIGIDDDLYGQVVAALVVLKDNEPEDESSIENILKECSVTLEPFMLPKKIKFIKEIPRTGNGKVLNKEVKKCLS